MMTIISVFPRRVVLPLVILLIVLVSLAVAFVQPATCRADRSTTNLLEGNSWFEPLNRVVSDFIANAAVTTTPTTSTTTSTQEDNRPNTKTVLDDSSNAKKMGRIIRTAVRSHQKNGASKPSSTQYTTRKDARAIVELSAGGVQDDYNHYRTVALSSTRDRAISLLTRDVMKFVKTVYASSQDGDLGENLLVDGLDYRDFKIGTMVRIGEDGGVILEITEPMEPCANLCKLPYINDASVDPPQRIEKCKTLIEKLGVHDGLRGWYAKVIAPGKVKVGDVLQLASAAAR